MSTSAGLSVEKHLLIGPDTPAEHLQRLAELLFGLEGLRTCLAQLVIRTPRIDAKIAVTKKLFLAQKALSSARERVDDLLMPEAMLGFRDSRLPSILAETVDRLSEELTTDVLEQYVLDYASSLKSRCSAICDQPSRLMLEQVESQLMDMGGGRPVERDFFNNDDADVQLRHIGEWQREITWPALPYRPARDESLTVLEIDQYAGRKGDYLAALHETVFTIEIPAFEICAMIIARFEPLPDRLEMDLARQCWDEGRHAEAMLQYFSEHGGRLYDYPIHLDLWDSAVKAGSPEEILGLEQVIGEGYNLGAEKRAIERHLQNGRDTLAKLLEFIYLDEIQHVRRGLTWFRELAGQNADSLLGRLEASSTVTGASEFNIELRRYVGFTDNEIERQLRRAGSHR